MAELLKNIYHDIFFERLTASILVVEPGFDKTSFLKAIHSPEWKDKELKERMRHITLTLKKHLHSDFRENLKFIIKLIPALLRNGFKPDNLEFIFLPDFIEVYGQDHYELSFKSFETITQFVTCEFAVRQFIIDHPKVSLKQMLAWTKHKNHMVRRFASEGCRPRLPWAIGIPELKKDPTPILPILEKLKNDPSEYVRRSVANNLNDISKDHPDIVIQLIKKWRGKTIETDALTKHACRSLLKQGHPEVMKIFGFGSTEQIEITDFKLLTPEVAIGNYLEFSFDLVNRSKTSTLIRLEYAVYYQKANGTLSKKVYKISEKDYPGSSTTPIHRKQSFRVITTRKLHPGLHQVAIIANGKEFEKYNFTLTES